jgi:hypothetical protein
MVVDREIPRTCVKENASFSSLKFTGPLGKGTNEDIVYTQ